MKTGPSEPICEVPYPQNTASCNSALDFIHLSAGFIHVEGPDDNHVGRIGEVSLWNGDLVYDVLTHYVNVVFQLG